MIWGLKKQFAITVVVPQTNLETLAQKEQDSEVGVQKYLEKPNWVGKSHFQKLSPQCQKDGKVSKEKRNIHI